jgi:hypothetical protein
MLFNSTFLRDAATRAVRSFAQTLAAALGGSALNVWSAGWHQSVGLAAGSALLALLMAVDRATASVAAPTVQAVPTFVAPTTTATVTACGDSLR